MRLIHFLRIFLPTSKSSCQILKIVSFVNVWGWHLCTTARATIRGFPFHKNVPHQPLCVLTVYMRCFVCGFWFGFGGFFCLLLFFFSASTFFTHIGNITVRDTHNSVRWVFLFVCCWFFFTASTFFTHISNITVRDTHNSVRS